MALRLARRVTECLLSGPSVKKPVFSSVTANSLGLLPSSHCWYLEPGLSPIYQRRISNAFGIVANAQFLLSRPCISIMLPPKLRHFRLRSLSDLHLLFSVNYILRYPSSPLGRCGSRRIDL
jgi:hypothetical protein